MKLTKETVAEILQKHQMACSPEELRAIFKLIGMQLKEFNSSTTAKRFELHYRRTYIVSVRIDRSKSIGFGNEWINWGSGSDGLSVGISNIKGLIEWVIIVFIQRYGLVPDFEGAQFDDRHEHEYTLPEWEELLEVLNNLLNSNTDGD